jgi:cytochrome c peroxidase
VEIRAKWRATALVVFGLLIGAAFKSDAEPARAQSKARLTPLQQLGERLFREEGFTAPNGDFLTSCRTCHLFDEDPQGQRAYTDFFNRSWAPYRTQDPRRSVTRNAPALYDVALMPRLHFDGEFGSLEELVKGTFGGRPLGWLPGEEAQAFAQVRAVLLREYAPQFKQVFNVELAKLNAEETLALVSKAVADYLRTFKSPQNSPYDRFIRANQLKEEGLLGELEKRADALKLTPGFDAAALRGLKIFLRTEGTASVGNCVACHAPPLFTDFAFHNLGISQVEYDQRHGEGKFAALQFPNASTAKRPDPRFREEPTRAKPGEVDLGHWNFVDLQKSPQRRAAETDDQFLQRMIATFKTPTLRHLAFSGPYMHTGAYTTLEDTLLEIKRLSELARAGQVRNADEELARIRISEVDIAPLLAFLQTLNEELKPGY